MAASFKINPVSLEELLRQCERGEISITQFPAKLGVGLHLAPQPFALGQARHRLKGVA